MSKEGHQKLSLVRLLVGVVVLCAIYPFAIALGGANALVLGAIGIAVVVNVSAVPNLPARSSILMCSVSGGLYLLVVFAVFYSPLVFDDPEGSVVAVTGFIGGTLLAGVAHYLLFQRSDPAMSLFVGALTVPSGLAFTIERHVLAADHGSPVLVHHLAWFVLFAFGLGSAAALRGRTVGSRP
jgi:hypothetical protein